MAIMPLLHADKDILDLRSTAAELLAFAICDLFPKVLLAGGGATDIGFYYDFIFPQPIQEHMLELIEVRMRALSKEEFEIRSLSMMRENAFDFFIHHKQPILANLALEEENNVLSLYQIGKFYDLVHSNVLLSLEEIKGIKLLDIEIVQRVLPGHEWGDIVRIKGTAFSNPYDLKQFLKAHEKLKKFDHRIIGPELQLFKFLEKTGDVDCFWLPKGYILLEKLTQLWVERCLQQNIQIISSPLVVPENFLSRKENLFPSFIVQDESYVLSQSRVKHHIQIFKELDNVLPLRLGEIFSVYENIEEVHRWGLYRKFSHLSDLVTIFCREDQVNQELIYSLQIFEQFITIFGFEAHWYLSGTENPSAQTKARKQGIEWLKQALEHLAIAYSEKPDAPGEPYLEVRFVDALGREWLGSSIGIIQPSREGDKQIPVIITRQLFGSLDRFVGLLTEFHKGHFPLWLAPEQIRILMVGEQNRTFAEQVFEKCKQQGWKVKLDGRDEKLSVKVHSAEKEKVPYLVIVGDKETSKGQVTVRSWQERERTDLFDVDAFLDKIRHTEIGIKQ